MDWQNEYRNNKGKLIAIGAGTLVLALIAFSGVCWGTLRLCGIWGSWTFWELFALLAVVMTTLLVIRPLQRRKSPGEDDPGPALLELEPEPEPIPVSTTTANWRDLYNQLSRDEQEAFKALMAKACGESPAPQEE